MVAASERLAVSYFCVQASYSGLICKLRRIFLNTGIMSKQLLTSLEKLSAAGVKTERKLVQRGPYVLESLID